MKKLEEIKSLSNIHIKAEGEDGFGGSYYDNKSGKSLNFKFSYGLGVEHLSVSTPYKCPSWEQMCVMKELFWEDDEVCIQLHPRKANYINNHPYCLHIWRFVNEEVPLPPDIMVGLRDYTQEEQIEIIEMIANQKTMKKQYEIEEQLKLVENQFIDNQKSPEYLRDMKSAYDEGYMEALKWVMNEEEGPQIKLIDFEGKQVSKAEFTKAIVDMIKKEAKLKDEEV